MSDQSTKEPSLFDPVWGARNIGKEINLGPRQALYLLEIGALPARKLANRWVAERGTLRAAITGKALSEM
jgi:hypothetical protein